MKKIYFASLQANGATDMDGNPCEWEWIESNEAEFGEDWDGDVRGYLLNLAEDEDAMAAAMARNYHGAIHNRPADAIVLVDENGEPQEIWWAE